MSKKKSDALQALIAEQVDLERDYRAAVDIEEEARQESVAAAQALTSARDKATTVRSRLNLTTESIGLLLTRDEISQETYAALVERERGR